MLCVQPVADEVLIYDQRSRHIRRLNRTAALIWRHCDGRRSIRDLTELARSELNAPQLKENVVQRAVDRLDKSGLLVEAPAHTRRAAPRIRRAGRGRQFAGAHMPVVASFLAPTPIMAASSNLGCGSHCIGMNDCSQSHDICTVCDTNPGSHTFRNCIQPV
jgi:hypothetical protein